MKRIGVEVMRMVKIIVRILSDYFEFFFFYELLDCCKNSIF